MPDSTEEWQRFFPEAHRNGFREDFAAEYAGEIVCVAGAAGFIGSALVKALAREDLRSLILLDSSEHGLFEIRRHMQAAHPKMTCECILGSVNDRGLLDSVFSGVRPHIVFHAAAFKHVELLEHSPFAAIKNNVLGTYRLLQAALEYDVPKLVLLSTDKAANPHSVMGVSKRLAELLTVSLSSPKFRASAIRLGNVIGSRGSVIPIFLDQLAEHQAVSVTHPQASRYFLSREESVSAILAAGNAACDGMVLIPDFAAPVLIVELARFLARTYSASEQLCFIGLKPGEKLTEDLTAPNETEAGTVAGPLQVIRTPKLSVRECQEAVAQLSDCVADRDCSRLLQLLCQLVPEYVPSRLMQEAR